ncbi:MAG: hypothetical protein IKS85_08600, partial [Lachnospiraceae bacterium]|nr:hypothetical protein [Lachnospiraceae bacterium]
AFAFGDFQVNLTEGDEEDLATALVPVYRIGGTRGRAEVAILYSPAISQVTDEDYILDYAASALDDLRLEVEDTNPVAQYQPLGVVHAVPSEIAPAAGTSDDEEHPVELYLPGVESVKYQWQIQLGKQDEWEDIPTERSATLKLTQEDYEGNDFRCIYFDGGVNYGTKSLYGAPYVPFTEELPELPEEGISLNYEPGYYPVVPDDKYQQVLFDLTFAEGETVKYVKVTVLDDDELELQEMGLLTLVGHKGGVINSTSSTMTILVNDNEEAIASEIGFEVTDVTVDQDEQEAVLTVKRTGGLNYMVTVDYATEDGTAIAGQQYTETTGTLSFLGSIDTLDITVPLIAEEARSEELEFSVVLSNLMGGGTEELATLGEARAVVHLSSDGSVVMLADGLNLSSVLAQGSSGATQVSVSQQGALLDADKTVTGEQTVSDKALIPAKYVKLSNNIPDDGHGHAYDPKAYTLKKGVTFDRGENPSTYNGWKEWEIVCDVDGHFNYDIYDKAYTQDYAYKFYEDLSTTVLPDSWKTAASIYGNEFGLTVRTGYQTSGKLDIKDGGYLYDAAEFVCEWEKIGYGDLGIFVIDHFVAPCWTMWLGNSNTRVWNGNLSASKSGVTGTDWQHITQYDRSWYSNADHGECWVQMKGNGKSFSDGAESSFTYEKTRNSDNTYSTQNGTVPISMGGDVGVEVAGYLRLAWEYGNEYYQSDESTENDGDGQQGVMKVNRLGYHRRTFDKNTFGVVLCTANDNDTQNAWNEIAVLDDDPNDLDEGLYTLMAPVISVDTANGGVSRDGRPFVGSILKIKIPDQLPAGYTCTGVYLVKIDNNTRTTVSTATPSNNEYSLELKWNAMTTDDLTKDYAIYVNYQRKQIIEVDIEGSLPKDDDGNIICCEYDAQGNPIRNYLEETLAMFNGITYKQGADRDTEHGYSLSGANSTKPTFTVDDLQTINFHQDHDDFIVYDGVSYAGDHTFVLTRKDLTQKKLSFRFFDSEYTRTPNKMTISISSVSICYDANGNGRIDGYYSLDGVFVPQNGDKIVANLGGDETFSEDYFKPYVDDANHDHQYFLKVYYSMMPKCLTLPEGESEDTTVRVLPAFVSSVTNSQQAGQLSYEQGIYRYIKAGEGRYQIKKGEVPGEETYADTSTGQPMYTEAATKVRMVDIPLGGDLSAPVQTDDGWRWDTNFKGNLLFPYEHPQEIIIDPKDNITGADVYVAGQIGELSFEDGKLVYSFTKPEAIQKINGYLGSFYAKNNFALCVNEKTDLKSEDDIHPETYNLGNVKTIPTAASLNNVGGGQGAETEGSTQGNNNEYPEFDAGLGMNLPSLEFNVTDYVTITMDGNTIGFSVGIPLVNKKYEARHGMSNNNSGSGSGSGSGQQSGGQQSGGQQSGGQQSGGQQSGGQQSGGQQSGGQQSGGQQSGGQQSGGQQSGGQQSGGQQSGGNGTWNSGADVAGDAHEGIQKLWHFIQNPKQFTKDDWDEKGKSIEMHGFSIGFSINFAFMWEYNAIDDCFYFKSGAISAAASLEFRVEARLTPCPIFYLYVVFGASLEIGTGFTLLREEKEGMDIHVKSMGNVSISENRPAVLKKGEKMIFSLRVNDSTRGFKMGNLKGKIHILVKDEEGNSLKSGKYEAYPAKDYSVPLPSDYEDKGVLTVEVTALEETTLDKLCGIFAESKYIWNGVSIAPELSIEAGAGIGMELLKVEVFIKVTLGMAFTLGTYFTDEENNEGDGGGSYDHCSFDSLDFSAVVGFNLTVLFFDYSMDIVGYYLHGERKENTEHDMVWSDHWGLANGHHDNIGDGNIDDPGDHEGDKAYASGATFSLSKPKDISGKQYLVKSNGDGNRNVTEMFANGKVNRSIAANDVNVPFQLSNYGTSGDAFRLAGGMTTGYDYKAFSVNGESYVLYPISVGADNAEDPVDYTQLVMSKVVVTSSSTGLVNPLDPNAEQAYIAVDEPDEDGKNTGDLDYDVSVDGTKITVAYATYETHSDGSADSVSVTKTVVIRRAVIDLADENPAFSVETLTESGKYQFLPQQEGNVTIYAGVTDKNSEEADAMLAQFSAYLQAKFNVAEADITAANPKAEHFAPASRFQVESIQRSI